MRKFTLFFCSLLMTAVIQAQIIHVPADYATIQLGINAATPGDTVLVAEGTYYEQINFLGKKPLMVASRFLMDGDTSHISNTIIDGSQLTNLDSASVVYFISGEDTTSVLCGFTVTKGKGSQFTLYGYTWRAGAGVFIDGSGAKIIHNHITENRLDGTLPYSVKIATGAGIFSQWNIANHWVVIDNNVIDHNSCILGSEESSGAGLEVTYNCRIINNTISNNTCKVGLNGTAVASAIYCGITPEWNPHVTAIVHNNIIKNNLIESQSTTSSGAAGLFQAVTGIFSDNEVSGNKAQGSATGGLIFVEPKDGTVIRNNVFRGNLCSDVGGGIYMMAYSNPNTSTVLVENNYFYDNVAKEGGAFATYDIPVKLQNNVFSGNQSVRGGAICLERVSNTNLVHLATLINNSFSRNTASYGGAIASSNSKPLIINSVFWGDSADYGREIYLFGNDKVEIANTTINSDSIHIKGTLIDGGGILNTDPMFTDSVLLTTEPFSPCVDAGAPAFTCLCGDNFMAPAIDITGVPRPQGNGYDRGAYDLRYSGIGIPDIQNNLQFAAWPDPFFASINFRYNVVESSLVTLHVFDSFGRLVAEPVNEFQQNGEHTEIWNAESLPAGIYYCRLQAGNQLISEKVIKIN